jgi:3-oxoadipate enol-lactonase
MPATTGTAQAGDGCALAYRLHRQEGKPRLVLIHSLALDMSLWDGLAAALAGRFEILAYDCRGHGRSERRPGPYSTRQFATDLAALLDHCGWESALVAGCSMGGCVAQAFAAAYPDRAKGLALIDTTAWYGPEAPTQWRERGAKAATDGFASMVPFQTTRWFSDGFRQRRPETVAALARVFQANDVACYEAACAMLGDADARRDLASFRLPVAVIVGEEDYATPIAMAEALYTGIEGATFNVIRGGRHLTPAECPEEIAKHLDALAQRAAAR